MKEPKSFQDYKYIKTSEIYYTKNNGRWKETNKRNFLSSENEHKRSTDDKTLRYFRGLGGIEKVERRYTRHGYDVVKNESISPSGDIKIVRTYDFDNSGKLYDKAINENRKAWASYNKRRTKGKIIDG